MRRLRPAPWLAGEAGIDDLVSSLIEDPTQDPEARAGLFVVEGFADVKAVLEGAKQIIMQRAAEDAELIEIVRQRLRERGHVLSKVYEGKEQEGAKFRDYFDFRESWETLPSHRILALLRGRDKAILMLDLVDEDAGDDVPFIWSETMRALGISRWGRPADEWLAQAAKKAARLKVGIRAELSLMGELRERAEKDAIEIFASNLRDLLLAAPAGPKITMGLDPGIRTGVKVAVVDANGKLLDTSTIYPHPPRRDWQGSLATLKLLVERHNVDLVAIGNGTASRETDKLTADLMAQLTRKVAKIVVSEAGASVYSASQLASDELPGVDVTLRGAVSIARRLQDPLAELVKIDPKSIGVGQYQHDVNPFELERGLETVVEDCVNAVGVDLNTASPALLAQVSGLGGTTAQNVVDWRDKNGSFKTRKQLLKVARLGPRTFQLCAGFLRISGGDEPLDASGVHPEAYPERAY